MTIQIACASDAAFVPHVATLLHSLMAIDHGETVSVHFLCDESVDAASEAALKALVTDARGAWTCHRVPPAMAAEVPDNERFGRAAWFRIFLPRLLPDCERVLYLDADALVLDVLGELWRSDLRGNALGAVVNPLYPSMSLAFLARLGVQSAAQYFNSGVLLMDLQRWREDRLDERVLAEAQRSAASETWPDQNILNREFAGRWTALPLRYNVQNTVFDLRVADLPVDAAQVADARARPAVVHFIGPYKPWHRRCNHPARGLYWAHRRQTPWPTAPLQGDTAWNRLLARLPMRWGWIADVAVARIGARLRRAGR
ncbi:MAG TPA: glycosyltransferase family 8 protein [Fontimonas sp.]